MTTADTGARATFSAMTEGSQADWDIIYTKFLEFNAGIADRVLAHLRLLEGDTGGFAVDRLEHSLQTATRAHRAGKDEEYVVCALLHDVGDTLGGYNHADVAAAIVKPFVSPENHWMVEHHAIFQGYYFFHYLGLDRNQRDEFRDHPCYDRTDEFTAEYDQPAFDRHYRSMTLADFEPAVRSVLAAPRKSIYVAE